MPLPPLVQREIINTLARFRNEAARGDAAVIRQLADAYRKLHTRLQEQLELEARRIFEKPESAISREYVRRRLSALADEIQQELDRYSSFLSTTLDASTDRTLLLGSKHAVELMQMATLGRKAIKSVDFGLLKPEQINTMIAFLSPNSPLYKKIGQLARFHGPIVRDQLVEAIALGYNPYKAAGNIAPFLQDIANKFQIAMARPFADAVRLARTSMLWAYREAGRANYQANGDVVTHWQWFAHLDGLTCMSCVSMHGTIHPLSEPLDDHHHGRCAAVPVVLGQALVPEDAGAAWFNGLPEEQQRIMMGTGAFDAWKAGKFELSQLSHQVPDDVYDLMRTVTPLKELLQS